MAELTRAEQETIITWNNEDKNAEVYTFDQVLIRKIEKLVEKGLCANGETMASGARVYNVPKRTVKVIFPRVLTEEQKEKQRARLAVARTKQKIVN